MGSLLQVFEEHLLKPKLVLLVQRYLYVKREAKLVRRGQEKGGGGGGCGTGIRTGGGQERGIPFFASPIPSLFMPATKASK